MGWYYKLVETEHGPVSEDELASLFKNGTLNLKTRIKEDDSFAWRPLNQTEIGEELGFFEKTYENVKGERLPYDPTKVKKLGWRSALLLFATWVIPTWWSGWLVSYLAGRVSDVFIEDSITDDAHIVEPQDALIALAATFISAFAFLLSCIALLRITQIILAFINRWAPRKCSPCSTRPCSPEISSSPAFSLPAA